MPDPTPFRRPFLSLLGLVALLAACRSAEVEGEPDVVWDIQHGRYAQALAEARRLVEREPGDTYYRQLLLDAQVAFILHQGRQKVFRGDLEGGLAHLEEAEALSPDNPTVASWIEKTRAQLAVKWLDAAAERTGPENLDEAEVCFEKVLQYDPDNEDAIRGLSQLLLLKNYRAGMSKTYFDDGLTSFRELLLVQARRNFQVSRHYAENEPAAARGKQVEKLMAEDRLAQAQQLEADGLYFAARNEYRLVLLIDPGNVEGRAGLDRMDREARATRSLDEADMAIRRGELEQAEETLAEAEILTDAQRDDVSLLQSGIEERRLEDMYQAASSLVDDNRYPEAVQAFAQLLAVDPDYKDAALRKATVEEFITLAEEFYAKAAAATSDEEVEGFLRQVHILWPEYKDVGERLHALEARRAEQAQAGDGTQEAEEDDPDGEGRG